jgi:PAS domain S-box-containing protein
MSASLSGLLPVFSLAVVGLVLGLRRRALPDATLADAAALPVLPDPPLPNPSLPDPPLPDRPGLPVNHHQTFVDITTQFHIPLSAARMGLWSRDLVTGVLSWSAEHEQLFGLEVGSFDGTEETCRRLVHPEDQVALWATFYQSIEDRSVFQAEFRTVWPDGSVHWIEARGQAVYDEAGQPVRMAGTGVDISDRKAAETARQQQIDRERVVTQIAQRIRQSLQLDEILTTTVEDVRQFLQVDRTIVFQFNPTWDGRVIVESVAEGCQSIQSTLIHDPCFEDNYAEPFRKGLVTAKSDVQDGNISPCHLELLSSFQVRANLVVPILQDDNLWGLLIAHHCQAPRPWQSMEIELLQQLAVQLGIAIQQASLLAQLRVELRERRWTEAALRQSEERWQLAITGSNDGIWDHNLTTNDYFLSPRCLQILGYHSYSIHSYDQWLSYIHGDDLALVQSAWQTHLDRGTQSFSCEYRMCCSNGQYKWILMRGKALWDDADRPIRAVGSITDITDRKTAEAELTEAKTSLEARVQERTNELRQYADELQDLYNNAPCGYHSLDAEGRFVLINDTELLWLGYSREEILGYRFDQLLTPESQSEFRQHFPLFLARGWLSDMEFELICKDGSRLPIILNATSIRDNNGQYLMSRSMIFDIRDRKQAQSALEEAERRWRSLLDNVQLVVVGLNQMGRIDYCNPFFLALTGYGRSEVIGQDWGRMFLPPSAELLLPSSRQGYSEYELVTRSGERRTIAWNSTLLRNSHGVEIGVMSIGEDITRRQEVDRLKGEFISIVSHELRTPLTAIRGSLGLLASGIYDQRPDKRQKMLQVASEQTERLVRLVNDILDLQRLESGKVQLNMQSCRADQLLRQAVEALYAYAEASQIRVTIEAEPIALWADPDAVIQLLTNLLSNGIKFSPTGSHIQLKVAESPAPENPVADRGPEIHFTVEDQGRGIPSDKLEHIFEQFQQVDASDSRQKGGTGLGLAICRHIVGQHGGRIWAESELGQGSTFTFTLPADRLAHSPDNGVPTLPFASPLDPDT